MHSNLAPYQKHLNIERSSDEWITGTEIISTEQKIYLKQLSILAGENFNEEITLSKVSATERIMLLKQKVGRKI